MERRTRNQEQRFKVQIQEHGTGRTFPGYTTSISPTGMFVQAEHAVPHGRRLRVTLESDNAVSTLEAEVARVRRSLSDVQGFGMGLRFLTPQEIVGELLPAVDECHDGGAIAQA